MKKDMWSIEKIENQELVDFIKKGDFFSTPFLLNINFEVIKDGEWADTYATDCNSDVYADWQMLWDEELDRLGVYDEITSHIEWKISDFIDENFHYELNFNGALQKVRYDEESQTSLLFNNMEGDLFRLLQCEALGKTSLFIEKVKQAYLNNGFPCGWKGSYPNGKLIVFSNEN